MFWGPSSDPDAQNLGVTGKYDTALSPSPGDDFSMVAVGGRGRRS